MDSTLATSDILGPSCFNLLARHITKNKTGQYPFEQLFPFIQNADDLYAISDFLEREGINLKDKEAWQHLIVRIASEASPIIIHEYNEIKGEPTDAYKNQLEDFLRLSKNTDCATALDLFRKILLGENDIPKARQFDFLRACRFTHNESMREIFYEVLAKCETAACEYDIQQKDYLLKLAYGTNPTDDDTKKLFIASALPLLVDRGAAGRLAEIFEGPRMDSKTQDFLFHACSASLRNL